MTYEYLCRKYNTNVLGLKFGSTLTVIINSYKLVRQALTTDVFEGRSDNFFVRLRCLGSRLGITCVDGPFWIEQRKFVERHLKSVGYGKKPMESLIQGEVEDILEILSKNKNQSIEFGKLLAPSILNVLWTISTGDKLSRDDPRITYFLTLLNNRNTAFDMAGGVLNSLPWLRFIIPERIGYNLIKKLNEQLKDFFQETIKQHHETWSDNRRDDIIYSFITEKKTNLQSNNFTGILFLNL